MKLSYLLFALFFSAGTLAFGQQNILPIDFDLAKLEKQKPVIGQQVTIDTRDILTCKKIRATLDPDGSRGFKDLCEHNQEKPYATVVMFTEPREEESRVLYELNEDQMIHVNNARNVVILGVATVGRFLAQGYGASNWTPPGKDPLKSWWKNVSRPPVIDKDDFKTNYIEHPLAGAVYYSIARHSGFSILESFGFSVFSSTFLWEYGLEAFFERPSINDLIVTPLLGSLLGEIFYQVFNRIVDNDGKILGSRTLGFITQIITNPGFFLSAGLNYALGAEWFKSGDIGWVVTNRSQRLGIAPIRSEDYARELSLRFRLKF